LITVQLSGGMGNQMFQYAAALALARLRNTEVSFDLSILKEHQGYALSCFNIVPRVSLDRDLPIRLRSAIPPLLRKLKSVGERSIPIMKQTVLLEAETYSFDPAFLQCGSTCYLSGYFQHCSYFKHAETHVREAFTFKPNISRPTKELLSHISKVHTVSVHVRRGDYLRNSEFRGFFGTCGIDYYANSCEIMARISGPAFWVFVSDDPQWVRSNLVPRLLQRKIISEHVVADWNNGPRAFEDLLLMCAARDHIISNSTFAWWGAWLSARPDKKVIAPRRWILAKNVHGILPDEWLTVENNGESWD
jgi:Glycosyl transferase family 11